MGRTHTDTTTKTGWSPSCRRPALRAYYYAGDGSRVAAVTVESGSTNTTVFVLDYADPLRRPLAELDGNGALIRRFVWGRGVVAQVEADGTIRYFHHDGQGSTLALSDTNNVPTDQWFYSPYGEVMARTGATDTPYQWCGGVGLRPAAGNLYFARHRYYHARLQRWTARDPLGMAGGPNLYAYAMNAPFLYYDPLGLWSWNQTFGVMRAVGGGLEAAAGYSLATASAAFGAASSWTGVGLVAGAAGTAGGIAVGAHGIDQFQAGVRQAFTDEQVDSLTSVALQETTGMSQNTANLVDAGISVVGSIGAGVGTTAIRAQSALSSQAANAPLWKQVLYHEIGQKTLSDDANAFYSALYANPVDRGAAIVADQGLRQALRPEASGWWLGIGQTFSTGPTPLGMGGAAATFTGVSAAGQYRADAGPGRNK
jgi:RHS repeat-associated protein